VFKAANELDPSLKINPQARANRYLVADLLRKGDVQVGAGHIDEAKKSYVKAQELDPSQKFDPQARANRLVAASMMQKAILDLRNGSATVEQAVAEFSKAEQLDSESITAINWNNLCWYGTLLDGAREVIGACEKAVQASSGDWNIVDSRGLARALTNNVPGAIADFQVVVKTTNNNDVKKTRQAWLDSLIAGKNPFTPDVMDALRTQEKLVMRAK
jgi:tetratricopeptide (TPR) repeat protein